MNGFHDSPPGQVVRLGLMTEPHYVEGRAREQLKLLQEAINGGVRTTVVIVGIVHASALAFQYGSRFWGLGDDRVGSGSSGNNLVKA